jgi:hypothetical protein
MVVAYYSRMKHNILRTAERLEATLPEEVTIDGQSLSSRDPNFQSELEYDGYKDIEESDNDEYNSNVESLEADAPRELNFEDRPEDDSITTEENVVDKQENRKS